MQPDNDTSPNLSENSSNLHSFGRQPTFVVAFALKETYDDLITAQQMICNKRSPQESANSITPTNSLKLFESIPAVKLDQIPDFSEDLIAGTPHRITEKSLTALVINTSEPNLKDLDKIIPFIETDGTTDSSNDERSNPIKKNVAEIDQPEIIFNATNYTQRCKENKFVKRKSKIHKIIRPKCNKFICKNPKINLKNRLEKYYDKVKKNSGSSGQIREGLSNISNVISRTTVLKQAFAKENLLEDIDTPSNDQIIPFNENDDTSLASSPSTAKNDSFISNSSEKTLTYVSSNTSLRNEDLNNISVNSTIEIPQGTPPFKSDVINVAVAVAYNKSKTLTSTNNLNNNEKFMHLGTLTSEPDARENNLNIVDLTSKFPSHCENKEGLVRMDQSDDTPKASNTTIGKRKSSFNVSSDENLTFDMARTSSEFNDSTASTFTLKKDDIVTRNTEDEIKTSKRKQSLLQTVINLGYYPEVTPSSSSGEAVNISKDVLITNLNQHYVFNSKDMGDHRNAKKELNNVLKKQYEDNFASPSKKTLNLPDHSRIEEMLTEDAKDMKYSDESAKQKVCPDEHKHAFSLSDMFDKLIVVLDTAFQRLETSVTEKIISELKNSFTLFERYIKPEPEIDMNLEKGDIIVIEPSREIIKKTSSKAKEADGIAQCDLVQSEVIDEIMSKFSTQSRKVIEAERTVKSLQHLKTKWFKDKYDGSKTSTAISPDLTNVREEDTISVVTNKTFVRNKLDTLRVMIFGVTKFVKANVVVISSIPIFIIAVFIIYGLLMLIA